MNGIKKISLNHGDGITEKIRDRVQVPSKYDV